MEEKILKRLAGGPKSLLQLREMETPGVNDGATQLALNRLHREGKARPLLSQFNRRTGLWVLADYVEKPLPAGDEFVPMSVRRAGEARAKNLRNSRQKARG